MTETEEEKNRATLGAKRILELKDPEAIFNWQFDEGIHIRLGAVTTVEIWEKADQVILAVQNPFWQIHPVKLIKGEYHITTNQIGLKP